MVDDKKEKVFIYSIIAIIFVVLILVIINIWSPTFSKLEKTSINIYKNLTYEDEVKSYYEKFFKENLKITNFDKLYEKIDKDYMNEIGIENKDELKQFLRDKKLISMSADVNSIELYPSTYGDNKFVVSYTVLGEQKYINIVEKSPYNFKISFAQSNNLTDLLTDINLNRTSDNINYNFEIIESTINGIRFKLTITNESNNTVLYDFSYLNSIQLRYNDNKYINMAAIANSSTVNYEINPKSSKSIEILFGLSFNEQVNIQGARFNNVKINGENYTVEI